MSVHKTAGRWLFALLIGLSISASCEAPRDEGAPEAAPAPSQGSAERTPELRAAYIAAVQSDADESYRATRDISGAARFVHLSQGIEATLDGYEVRLAPAEAGSWDLSLVTSEVGCEGDAAIGLPGGAAEMSGNRVEIARGSVREWYVNGPLGIEQGFTLERAPSCEGTKVVTLEVGGSAEPSLVDADGDGRGEAVAFVDAEGRAVARYTDLFVEDAKGERLPAWLTVTEGEISLHFDDAQAAYPVQIDPLIWVEQAKLLASDGASSDEFGAATALSGDTAIVGASGHKVGANYGQGAAYVFTRSGGKWSQQQKLVASDGAGADSFGFSVAVSGDTALVGAVYDDVGNNLGQGSAYVFTRSGAAWAQQQKLVASDGTSDDYFGYSVALSGDTALIGVPLGDAVVSSSGTAYAFTRSGVVWSEQVKFGAGDGALNDKFGYSVALSGDTAIVGVPGDNIGFVSDQGSAYVFTRSGAMWAWQQKLVASDGASSDAFGTSVALVGDTALVGAQGDDIAGNSDQGSAYVFTRSGAMWTQQQKLVASDGAAGASFGGRVATSGDMALIGAAFKDVGANSEQGAAYLFTRSGALWTQDQIFLASDGKANDNFGSSVALSADTAIVGAQAANIGASSDQGAVYVFVPPKPLGGACASDAECLVGLCVDAVCCDSACGGGVLDDCLACSEAAGAAVNGQCALLSAGTACRPAENLCDAVEACDGVSDACPADAKVAAGTECRPSGGSCDVPESCDGVSIACPADVKVAAGTLCRAATGPCDPAESCNGVFAMCPADAKVPAGTTCRAATGPCDAVESCDGVSGACPADVKAAAGAECRASTGACDSAEICDGVSILCPADVKAAAGTTCRASAGPCDVAEICDGASVLCPADAIAPIATECRGPAGACDVAETCDGASITCPADKKASAGSVCRAPARECDVVEACDGTADDCPADMSAPNGIPCSDGSCVNGICINGISSSSGGSSGSGDDTDDDDQPVRDPSGCSCRAAGTAPGEPSLAALSLLGFALLVTRRSRRA